MDKALKQRLVGASVLIALAVVVLPMLLSGQPDEPQDARRIEVPPKPAELSFETRRFPIQGQAEGQPSQVTVVEPPATPGANAAGEAQTATTEAPVPPPAQPATEEPGLPEVEQTEGDDEQAVMPGRYLVQVGSFSTAGNANRLAGRLRDAGLPVLMDTVDTNATRLHRVRVGPYDREAQAHEVARDIRARMPDLADLNPRVLDLRPDESAPVTEPSDPLVRWVVQTGSFSDTANAEAQVGRLREAGFTAYSVRISDPEGESYKVRVGPVIERQSAVELAAQLRQDLAIDGLVIGVD